MAQGFDGVHTGRRASGIEAKDDSNPNGDPERQGQAAPDDLWRQAQDHRADFGRRLTALSHKFLSQPLNALKGHWSQQS